MADSVFKDIAGAPPIEVFQLSKNFQDSTDPNKVNLGVGAYRNDEGKPWVLPVVSTAELQMANDRTLNHEYLPISGLQDFRQAALRFLFGPDHRVIAENRVEGFQCLGGTGALRLAADFLKRVVGFDTVYVSSPTWGNHKSIFKSVGFSQIRDYRYWDPENRSLNFDGMCEDLLVAPVNSVAILHAVAHNPTGVDLSKDQWMKIAKICMEKQLFVLMDCAYQGFATGNIDDDAWAPRYFADQGIDMFVAQSFSKNFGLYNERTGNLAVVTKDPQKLPEIRSQMEISIRVMWSNPSNHGARIVATILNNKAYFEDWKGQLVQMSDRIKKMRQELADNLKKLGTPGNWDHIVKQIGMFSYTGLTPKQVEYMLSKHVFMLGSGRISIAGLSPKNVQYVAKCMDEAIKAFPILKLTAAAGVSAPESKPLSFVEFARRKLEKTTDYQVIKTNVVIDGFIFNENLDQKDGELEMSDLESVKSFVKVQIEGSFSSLSVSTVDIHQQYDMKVQETSSPTDQQLPNVAPRGSVSALTDSQTGDTHDVTSETGVEPRSNQTEAGTLRSTVKTFKTRSQQTIPSEKLEEKTQLKGVPARFEGTMLTPIYFEGRMMTPERLDQILAEAAKKKEGLSIPVTFEGGMLTAAFRALNAGQQMSVFGGDQAGDVSVPVKFSGRLQEVVDGDGGYTDLPVMFDGTMATKANPPKSEKINK